MKKLFLALALSLLPSLAVAQCNGQFATGTICGVASGGPKLPGQAVASGFIGAIFPTPTRAGDIIFWNGSTWVTLAGNNSGTNVLQETSAGVPSWVAGLLAANNLSDVASKATSQNNLFPTPTRAGDITYWNGSNWVTLAGNNSGTQILSENSSGVPSWIATGAVSSVTIAGTAGTIAVSGTCTITTSGTCTLDLAAGRKTLPTISLVTTSAHNGGFGANTSGTYTTPANVLWIEIEIVGGGAGGNGNSVSGAAGASCWNTAGAACTTPVYSAGGGSAGGGGTIAGSSTCTVASLSGSNGQGGVSTTAGTSSAGGIGGSTVLQGAGTGAGGGAGGAANADTGSGGGGGGVSSAVANSATGGGSGATCRVIIGTPAATYTYVVGAKSTGGAAGGSILAGGNGADGRITVIEHYGS
jgi:hypothetical protein